MGLLRTMFGPSRAEIWRQLADRLGVPYQEAGFARSDRIDVTHDAWTISLDTYYNPGTKQTLTRLTAPYVNPENFKFTIYRHGIFSDLGKRLGMQDIEVDHADFDDAFVIKGTDESRVKALFASASVREQLMAQPSVHLSVEEGDSWFRKTIPEDVDRLTFQVPGVIKDIDRLEALFALMAETLDRLAEIGVAEGVRPRA